MSLKFNNVNYSCRISNRSNNSTTLSCAPQRTIENFQVVSNDKLTAAGWYQIAGTVSGTGGPADSNVFTTDSNWAYNNERIPSKKSSWKMSSPRNLSRESNSNKHYPQISFLSVELFPKHLRICSN